MAQMKFLALVLFVTTLVKGDSDVKLPEDFVQKASQQGMFLFLDIIPVRK